jgi:isopentenyl-diphosphate Delta-isomerase
MAEMFDVLDEQGNKTGEVLSDEIVRDRELWHGATHLWVINSLSEILLQYRAANKKLFPSCWDTSVAGHISAGDSAAKTAVKEAGEEVGLEINKDELVYLDRYPTTLHLIDGKPHKEYLSVFAVYKDFDLEKLTIQKEELTDLKKVSVEELEQILKDPTRRSELSGHDDRLFELAIKAARNQK